MTILITVFLVLKAGDQRDLRGAPMGGQGYSNVHQGIDLKVVFHRDSAQTFPRSATVPFHSFQIRLFHLFCQRYSEAYQEVVMLPKSRPLWLEKRTRGLRSSEGTCRRVTQSARLPRAVSCLSTAV